MLIREYLSDSHLLRVQCNIYGSWYRGNLAINLSRISDPLIFKTEQNQISHSNINIGVANIKFVSQGPCSEMKYCCSTYPPLSPPPFHHIVKSL